MKYLRERIKGAYLALVALMVVAQPFKRLVHGRNENGGDGEKRLLIVKLDHIGDYVLVRNFLKEIKASERYRGYRITFCGNASVRSIAEWLDGDCVDEFIWVDKNRIFKNPFYWGSILARVRGRFAAAIQPTYSRELQADWLIRFSEARERVGCDGDYNCIPQREKKKADRWYTRLISIKPEKVFEFLKNKDFFEQLLGSPLETKRPSIDRRFAAEAVPEILWGMIKKDFIVLFPGASLALRRWPPEKFAAIGDYVAEKYGYQAVVMGAPFDRLLGETITASANSGNVLDLTGRTKLSELVGIFTKARLVVSNDTSAVHFAAALGIPAIVLSQFNLYGRFVPYPSDMARAPMACVTPEKYSDLSEEDLIRKFSGGSAESIDSITVDQAERAIDGILNGIR